METRQIEQIKTYSLHLNSIYQRHEDSVMVAIAFTKQELEDFYAECLGKEIYKEGNYQKIFKKGTPLENYNELTLTSSGGIGEHWYQESEIIQFFSDAASSFGMINYPELIGEAKEYFEGKIVPPPAKAETQ